MRRLRGKRVRLGCGGLRSEPREGQVSKSTSGVLEERPPRKSDRL
jgi:hypothetical protein